VWEVTALARQPRWPAAHALRADLLCCHSQSSSSSSHSPSQSSVEASSQSLPQVASSSCCRLHRPSRGSSPPPSSRGQEEAGTAPASRRRPCVSAHSTSSAATSKEAWSPSSLPPLSSPKPKPKPAVASSPRTEEGFARSSEEARRRPARTAGCKRPQRRSYAAATSFNELPLGRPTRLQNSMQKPRTRPTLGANASQASTKSRASPLLGARNAPSPLQRCLKAWRRSASGMTEGAKSSQVRSSTTSKQLTSEPRLGVRSCVRAPGSAMSCGAGPGPSCGPRGAPSPPAGEDGEHLRTSAGPARWPCPGSRP